MDEVDGVFEKLPVVDAFSFWLVVNGILFIYVGIQELAQHYGPGALLSTGAILLGVLYIILFFISRSEEKVAREVAMILSALAILGDFAAVIPLSGTSALLDFAGFMLLFSAYSGLNRPA